MRRTGKDGRDESGTAIHLNGDCARVREKFIEREQVTHCVCIREQRRELFCFKRCKKLHGSTEMNVALGVSE